MALSLTITINGQQQLIEHLQATEAELQDFSNAMKQIGTALISYYSEQVFASQGAVYGETWAPLSAISLYMRGATHTPLTGKEANFVGFLHNYRGQAGTLQNISAGMSARAPLTTGHPDGMQHSFQSQSDANSVTISNSKPYFKYHQSSAPRHRLPRRQMLGVNDDVKSIVMQYIQADIEAKIGANK